MPDWGNSSHLVVVDDYADTCIAAAHLDPRALDQCCLRVSQCPVEPGDLPLLHGWCLVLDIFCLRGSLGSYPGVQLLGLTWDG